MGTPQDHQEALDAIPHPETNPPASRPDQCPPSAEAPRPGLVVIKGVPVPEFDYPAAVKRAQEFFGLGNWSIVTKIDRKIPGCARTRINSEYLEATIKLNPGKIKAEGRDEYAVVEHEVMHVAMFPITAFFRRVLRVYVLDEKMRERLDDELDVWEHNALETVHRAFRPEARVWKGKEGNW